MPTSKTVRSRGFLNFWGVIVIVIVVLGGAVVGFFLLYSALARGQAAGQHHQAAAGFEKLGEWVKAREEYEAALRIQANYGDTRARLGTVVANQADQQAQAAATATAKAGEPMVTATAQARLALADVTAAAQAQAATATAQAQLDSATAMAEAEARSAAVATADAQAKSTATADAQARIEAHYQVGVAFQNAKSWDQAREEFQQVILGAPGYADAQDRLAAVNKVLGDLTLTATAEAHARDATATAATQAREAQATVEAQALAATQEAKLTAEKQAALATATADALAQLEVIYQRGLALMDRGQWLDAEAELQQVFAAAPGYKEVQAKLTELESKAEAEKQARSATATADAQARLETHYQRGVAYAALSRWAEARAEFEQVVAVDPLYKDVRDKFTEAEQQWDRLRTLTPVPSATPTPTDTPTPTPIPPTATVTNTPVPSTPNPAGTATARAEKLATMVAATRAALPTATATAAPNWDATATADAQELATAAAATVTALSMPQVGATSTRQVDGMVMVFVSAAEGFQMGDSDEKPVHTVALNGFWLDQTEVTNAQYGRCVAAGSCTASNYKDNPSFNGETQPVVGVDWDSARSYCQWAGARLPTEAEWEYAARGPEGRVYPWGNQWDAAKANAENKLGKTAPVGSYAAGASWVGALDLAGNVWEWVADWYGPYSSEKQTNPTGPTSGQYRVLRGGSWSPRSLSVRGADRYWNVPSGRHADVGFRCGRSY